MDNHLDKVLLLLPFRSDHGGALGSNYGLGRTRLGEAVVANHGSPAFASTVGTQYTQCLGLNGSSGLKIEGIPLHALYSGGVFGGAAGKFCIEAWLQYTDALDPTSPKYAVRVTAAINNYLAGTILGLRPGGYPWAQMGVGSEVNLVGPTPVAPNTWYFFKAVYDGTTFYLYVNGTLIASAAAGQTSVISNPTAGIYVGYDPNNVIRGWEGYVQDVRITFGESRGSEAHSRSTPMTTYVDSTAVVDIDPDEVCTVVARHHPSYKLAAAVSTNPALDGAWGMVLPSAKYDFTFFADGYNPLCNGVYEIE